MTVGEIKPQALARVDFSAPSLALAILFCGLTYSLPIKLFPADSPLNGPLSPEILNLYFLVGWMGLAHFIYAYYGQGKALNRQRHNLIPALVLVVLGLVGFATMRHFLGWMLFSFAMWVYFIPHFVKAELHFGTVLDKQEVPRGWAVYWFPALCFAFLTFAIFCPVEWAQHHWLFFFGAIGIAVSGVVAGVWKQLGDRAVSAYLILAFLFLGEGLVWGMYRQYMVPQFQQGVYVFHIAIASFYHYFRSYDFAARRGISQGAASGWRFLCGVIGINVAVIGTGVTVMASPALQQLLAPVFDVRYFTLWVGLHQYASDVFAWLKGKSAPKA